MPAPKDSRMIETRQKSDGSTSYRVHIRVRGHKPQSKTFTHYDHAVTWRDEKLREIEAGELGIIAETKTVAQAAELFVPDARKGVVRDRNGQPFSDSTIRLYESRLRLFVVPVIGHMRLSEVRAHNVERVVEEMLRKDKSPSSARHAISALTNLFKLGLKRGWCVSNPCHGITLPSPGTGRADFEPPTREEVEDLLACLTEFRALWATAFYAGLRKGELAGLRWEHVDLDHRIIRVVETYDPSIDRADPPRDVLRWPASGPGGFKATKTRAGRRSVPMPERLARELATWSLESGRSQGLVFGTDPEVPFQDWPYRYAKRTWEALGRKPVSFHEARHTYASLMIAAGVNPQSLKAYMGHSSITVTFDLYGHLFPGNEAEAAGLFDSYLDCPTANKGGMVAGASG